MKKQIVSLKRGAQKGFTLIELMIVIAIIGILAAFAVPMFQDYTVRTRVAEGLVLASTYKNAVTDNVVNGFAPGSNMPTFTATNNTATITVGAATGVITIKGSNKANDIELVLTPYAMYAPAGGGVAAESALQDPSGTGGKLPQGRISWKCTSTATEKNQIPSECR